MQQGVGQREDHRRHGHERGELRGHHDWHDASYVQQWIDMDVSRGEDRRPRIQQMLDLVPFDREAPVRVLDVGAGYGLLSGEVLKVFSSAHVTLQDFSAPMLGHARKRLAAFGDRVAFVTADFSRPGWTAGLGGPFDLAVSGIAIHNLADARVIQNVYREMASVLKPTGVFLDIDNIGGRAAETHAEWLARAGFGRVVMPYRDEQIAMFVAFKQRAAR